MIIVPEIETVVLLTPRTGTRSLKRAMVQRYPNSFLLYRHMEADGVPHGYDRWRKVGVVRHPVDRLWSLFNYLLQAGIGWGKGHAPEYLASLRKSADRPFEEWLVSNDTVFTHPYDTSGNGRFFPAYTCRHPLPENRKSQFVYLRPDLGTVVYRYDAIVDLYRALDVQPARENASGGGEPPRLGQDACAYVSRWFAWDLQASTEAEAA